MIKRFFLSLALFAGLLSPAHSAGTIGLSLTQRFDAVTTKPLNGGKLYFIQAGTTSTPQNAFQDSALTIPWPNPLTLDAGGNVPQLFFADGQIKIRLTNAAGINQIVADNILVVGASSGGGGGGTVDPTTILQTGDIKIRYGTGVHTGFVRQNGRTIGSSTSGATERANTDAQQLFEYLWNTDPNLVVSTGRGGSANADWVANKTITLPDMRGRSPFGLDDMGSTSASRLAPAMAGNLTLGGSGGTANTILGQANLPAVGYSLAGTAAVINSTSSAAFMQTNSGISAIQPSGAGTFWTGNNPSFSVGVSSTANYTPTGTIGPLGSSAAFNIIPPLMVMTIYQKL